MIEYGDYIDNLPIKISNQAENKKTEKHIKHLRVIGYAGVGKSKYIIDNYSYNEYLLLSYTQISSSQINGKTINSTFKLGKKNENSVDNAYKKIKSYTPCLFEHIQLIRGLVIDEFYTTPASVLEKVCALCQLIRCNNKPFGGLQLILVGDHRQTKSVEKSFVNSNLYKELDIDELILPEHPNMRLTYDYMQFCNIFRDPKLNRNKLLRLLNDDRFSKEELKNAYSVYYTNEEVYNKNKKCMEEFTSEVLLIKKGISYKKDCPIYIKNNCGLLCNGMIGFLRDKIKDTLKIEVDGVFYRVNQKRIEFIPGFAMTIHKCQSKTFTGVNIYLSKLSIINDRPTFIRLIYVALTRVRHFDRCFIYLF